MHYALRLLVFGVIFSLGLASSCTFAQSGSAGGSIGNDEKSLSGSRSDRSAEPAPSSRRSKPAAEQPHASSRRNGGDGAGGFDGSWTFSGTSTNCQGSGTGAFTVSGTRVTVAGGGRGSISPSGAFQATTSDGGVTLTATGRLSGSSGGGSYTRSDGCVGRWTASR